jgi:predicted transcriptional regulator
MRALRKESRAALKYVIAQGSTTCQQYAEHTGGYRKTVSECLIKLMDKGLLTRTRDGTTYIYRVTDIDRAKSVAEALPKEEVLRLKALAARQARKLARESKVVLPSPLPCSFVFNLGANA